MNEGSLAGTTWTCRSQDLLTALETLAEAGFRNIEVWADTVHLDPRTNPDVAAVAARLERLGATATSVHLPFDGVAPGADADTRAKEWIRLCRQTLDYAARLGARIAVAHPVLYGDADGALSRLADCCEAIAAHAATHGIELAMENMHTLRGPTLRTVAELHALIDRLDGSVGICVDIGHAVFNGRDVPNEIAAAGSRLIATHVHDSDAIGRDPHMVPGDGLVDWPRTLRAYDDVGYSGRYVLEVAGGDDPLATLLRTRERCTQLSAAETIRPPGHR